MTIVVWIVVTLAMIGAGTVSTWLVMLIAHAQMEVIETDPETEACARIDERKKATAATVTE